MTERHCKTCRKLRTDECSDQEECITHQYSAWAPYRHHKDCPKVGHGKMRVQKTDPVEGSTVTYTFLYCPICGYRIRVTREIEVLAPA